MAFKVVILKSFCLSIRFAVAFTDKLKEEAKLFLVRLYSFFFSFFLLTVQLQQLKCIQHWPIALHVQAALPWDVCMFPVLLSSVLLQNISVVFVPNSIFLWLPASQFSSLTAISSISTWRPLLQKKYYKKYWGQKCFVCILRQICLQQNPDSSHKHSRRDFNIQTQLPGL